MKATFHPAPPTSFALRGIDVATPVTDADTDGAWEAVHQTVAPGAGSPLHTVAADKLFAVVSGEVVLTIDGEEHLAGSGSLATVPAGVAHRFQNRSEAPARLVVVTTGGGHVAFLRGMAELGAGGMPDPGAVQAHAAAHHVQLLV